MARRLRKEQVQLTAEGEPGEPDGGKKPPRQRKPKQKKFRLPGKTLTRSLCLSVWQVYRIEERKVSEVITTPAGRKKTVVKTETIEVPDRAGFDAALRECWVWSTECLNWIIQQYLRADETGDPAGDIPPCPKMEDIYKAAARRYPGVPTRTINALEQSARKHYLRFRVAFWRGRQSPPLYRFPAPLPLPQQSVELHYCRVGKVGVVPESEYEGNQNLRPCFLFSTGSNEVGNTYWKVLLACGRDHARQLALFRRLMLRQAEQCAASLVRVRSDDRSRYPGTTTGEDGVVRQGERDPGGASRHGYKILFRQTCKLPRPAPAPRTNVLRLTTGEGVLWSADHEGRGPMSPWVLNRDDAADWSLAYRDMIEKHRAWLNEARFQHVLHKAKLNRDGQDRKVEQRTRIGGRASQRERVARRCHKARNRISTFLDQCVAGVVNYCIRQRVACLMYDDTCRDWCPAFPWAALRIRLRERCAAAGIDVGGCLAEEGPVCPDDPISDDLAAGDAMPSTPPTEASQTRAARSAAARQHNESVRQVKRAARKQREADEKAAAAAAGMRWLSNERKWQPEIARGN